MIDLDMFLEGGIDVNSTSDIKVGDKVRITYTGTGLPELMEVVEVYPDDGEFPIRAKFLGGEWKGHYRWLSIDHFRVGGDANPSSKVSIKEGGGQGDMPLIKAANDSTYHTELVEQEVEEVEVGKIKEGDYVVIDTTRSEDRALEGLHGKVVKVVEVDPNDSALPINVALPNGDSRWMYPEEFHRLPESDFNILVDSGKVKQYGEASGSVVPVIEVDYGCPLGFFFKVKSDGELLWVNRMECSVLLPEGEDTALLNEEVEFDFTVMKSYTNGAVNTFLRIDKQSKHFYDNTLLTEFNTVTTADLICRSAAAPDYAEGCNLLYLRGIEDSGDSVEIPIPDDCLEQVVTTLVDLKAWMLNRCKQ